MSLRQPKFFSHYWLFQSFRNGSGLLALILLNFAVFLFVLFTFSGYVYNQHFLLQLRGIYPPVFLENQQKDSIHGVISQRQDLEFRQEYFAKAKQICLQESMEPETRRKIKTNIRGVVPASLNDLNIPTSKQHGAIISLELFEALFGYIPEDLINIKRTLLFPSVDIYVGADCTVYDNEFVEVPVTQIMPLANNERWLILPNDLLEKTNVLLAVYPTVSVYGSVNEAQDVRWLAENTGGSVERWLSRLPFLYRVAWDIIQFSLLTIGIVVMVVISAYLINLFHLLLVELHNSLMLLKLYGVNKNRFLGWLFINTTLFISLIFLFNFGLVTLLAVWVDHLVPSTAYLRPFQNALVYLFFEQPLLSIMLIFLLCLPAAMAWMVFRKPDMGKAWKR